MLNVERLEARRTPASLVPLTSVPPVPLPSDVTVRWHDWQAGDGSHDWVIDGYSRALTAAEGAVVRQFLADWASGEVPFGAPMIFVSDPGAWALPPGALLTPPLGGVTSGVQNATVPFIGTSIPLTGFTLWGTQPVIPSAIPQLHLDLPPSP